MKAMRPLLAVMLAIIMGTTVFTGCGTATEKVATVDGVVINKAQYDEAYNELNQQFRAQFGDAMEQDPRVPNILKSMALQKLIMNSLIEQEATKLGVTVTDDDVKKVRDEQIKLLGGEDRLKKMLAQNKQTEKDFDEKIREVTLLNKFLEKKGGASLKPSDKDVEAYYIAHPKEFDMPETIRASHILVKAIDQEVRKQERDANKNLSEEELNKKVQEKRQQAKTKALELEKQIKAKPEVFTTLAEKESDDIVSGQKGGDLGPMVEKALDPVFWAAVKQTKPGEFYPGVLETQFGYHVIKVTDHQAPRHLSFAEAKPRIANVMESQKKMELLQKWEMEKKAQVKIDIDPKYQPKMPSMPGQPSEPAAASGPSKAPQPITTVPEPEKKASH
jgi:parvulin-like peptidyl-prolyl isomerase